MTIASTHPGYVHALMGKVPGAKPYNITGWVRNRDAVVERMRKCIKEDRAEGIDPTGLYSIETISASWLA